MKVPEHVAFSFLLAQFGVQQQFGWPGTALMIAAGCLPDLDGLGIVGGWRFYQKYHRILGHGLPMIVVGPLCLAGLGAAIFHLPLLPLWGWLQVSLFFHLLTDISFYSWPVQLIWPIPKKGWAVGLLSWNDLVPTILLYGGALLALVMPGKGNWIAILSMAGMTCYLVWRGLRTGEDSMWEAWLAGGWVARSPRFCRWLTGDFVT